MSLLPMIPTSYEEAVKQRGGARGWLTRAVHALCLLVVKPDVELIELEEGIRKLKEKLDKSRSAPVHSAIVSGR